MKLKTTVNDNYTFIEILADNGQAASAQNPISVAEYASVEYPSVYGGLAIISGMPMSAVAMVALYYKNVVSAIAIANPRNGVAEIVHSVSPTYKVGDTVPLPQPVM